MIGQDFMVDFLCQFPPNKNDNSNSKALTWQGLSSVKHKTFLLNSGLYPKEKEKNLAITQVQRNAISLS